MEILSYLTKDAIERFWSHIDKTKECWEWQIGTTTDGYGVMYLGKRSDGRKLRTGTHRISYVIYSGQEIPNDLHVLHKCDNRICINPEHLFLGTNYDNVQDKQKKGRGNQAKGERNSNAKLFEYQIRDIRDEYAKGLTQVELSKKFGISRSMINKIVNRITWKHVN